MKSVAVISLGCDKNRIDTEHVLYRLVSAGYAVSDVTDAQIIIVNTCAFIASAREESIDTILSCAELKKSGKCEKLIVTGCLPQKYLAELKAELPEVDAFLGTFDYDGIVRVVEGGEIELGADNFFADENCGRILTTFPHLAYLKIAEGCNNKCTFCTIPSIRGAYRSRPIEDIFAEAKKLVDDGVGELILVAQDVTRYGCDLGTNLCALLDRLTTLPALIRLLYCYPEQVTPELIEKIATAPNMAKYIDIPVQHFSNKILKLMNRKATGKQVEELIHTLHRKGITVRTTLMVGFPGETESDFNELVEFVKRAKPEYAGVFAYSKEQGTPAARLPGQVKKSEKARRVKELGRVCTEVTRDFNRSLVGKTLKVVYEDIDFDKNMFVGRTRFQTPDVDGVVYFTANGVDVGRTYDVLITNSDDYDLYGECVQTN